MCGILWAGQTADPIFLLERLEPPRSPAERANDRTPLVIPLFTKTSGARLRALLPPRRPAPARQTKDSRPMTVQNI